MPDKLVAEQYLISYVINNQDIASLFDKNIGVNDFITFKRELDYIINHYYKYGTIPSKKTFKQDNVNFSFIDDIDEPISYYIEKFYQEQTYKVLDKAISDNVDNLNPAGIETFITGLRGALSIVDDQYSNIDNINLSNYVKERLDKYNLVEESISYAWQSLQDATWGMSPGHLIIIAGRPKVGKTFLALFQMVELWKKHNISPLVFSLEMSNNEIMDRVDGIDCGICFSKFKRKKLNDVELDFYKRVLKKREDRKPFVIVENESWLKSMSLVQIEREIERANPGVVLIDGGYLLEPPASIDRGGWRDLTIITRSLKKIAKRRGIPIILTTQFNKGGWKKTGKSTPEMEDLAFGSSFAQDCDVLLSAHRSKDDIIARLGWMHILASRETAVVKYRINFDFVKMDFGEFSFPKGVYDNKEERRLIK